MTRRRLIPTVDSYGRITYEVDTEGMLSPVRHGSYGCVFDEADVKEVIGRYADCDVYKCPVCGREMDNRPYGSGPFTSSQGVVRLRR